MTSENPVRWDPEYLRSVLIEEGTTPLPGFGRMQLVDGTWITYRREHDAITTVPAYLRYCCHGVLKGWKIEETKTARSAPISIFPGTHTTQFDGGEAIA
jgi:hypothetical protein